jgi:hypothetical protein
LEISDLLKIENVKQIVAFLLLALERWFRYSIGDPSKGQPCAALR